jgi:hypothetical protein
MRQNAILRHSIAYEIKVKILKQHHLKYLHYYFSPHLILNECVSPLSATTFIPLFYKCFQTCCSSSILSRLSAWSMIISPLSEVGTKVRESQVRNWVDGVVDAAVILVLVLGGLEQGLGGKRRINRLLLIHILFVLTCRETFPRTFIASCNVSVRNPERLIRLSNKESDLRVVQPTLK